ncbi:hypothetical protein FRC06_008905, partial [Ceratobasidium sp. 370]
MVKTQVRLLSPASNQPTNHPPGLHFMWDDLLIGYRIRTLSNYTTPLPTSPTPSLPPSTLLRNRQIESALTGSNYDPLVRWIVLEGIYGWWKDQIDSWTGCPQIQSNTEGQEMFRTRPPFEDPVDVPVCPYHWAEPSHQMLCDFVWRADLQGVKDPKNVTYSIELNTPEYAGRVRGEKMVEKQLALGGLRLAAVLNEVLGSEEEKTVFGHKITATIAQIHLLPSTKLAICSILPRSSNCSLASIATWADDVKKQPEWTWSANLHFVNGLDDHPPENCTFIKYGWSADQNILRGIVNTTRQVKSSHGDQRDTSLRFLTHYLGDLHQPLHLTGRDAGGNQVPVIFAGQNASFHFMWDSLLTLYRIRTLSNYTTPLPTSPTPSLPERTLIRNRLIESALTGSNYDPLVRWIVVEGIYGWWKDEIDIWTACPRFGSSGEGQGMLRVRPPFDDPVDVPVCPHHWAKPTHQMLCDFIWRADLEGAKDPKNVTYSIELNTPEYAGRVRDEKMVEKQLALGG